MLKTIPYITTEQMIEVDRLMVEEYHIQLKQMMENAGRCLAALARDRFLDSDPAGKSVVVMAGPGGNGGGALVCARRLANWGATVKVVLSKKEESFAGVPAHQLGILRRMSISIADFREFESCKPHLVVDGLIGYSLAGPPREGAKHLIEWTLEQSVPVVSLDVPSGMDAGSGTVYSPCVKADATLTLALPKTGFRSDKAGKFIGELYLADISVPPEIYVKLGITEQPMLLFKDSDIVRIW